MLAGVTTSNPGILEVSAFNCILRELPARQTNLVHGRDRQLLVGMCESHFGKVKVKSNFAITKGGQSCQFRILQMSLQSLVQPLLVRAV